MNQDTSDLDDEIHLEYYGKNRIENKTFKPIFVQDEMSSSYLSYAMSVIVSRALPDVRDGWNLFTEELSTQCIREDMIGQSLLENQREYWWCDW